MSSKNTLKNYGESETVCLEGDTLFQKEWDESRYASIPSYTPGSVTFTKEEVEEAEKYGIHF